MVTLDMIITELQKYNQYACTMFKGATGIEIKTLESNLGLLLPGSFKSFLIKCNGLELMSETIYGIYTDESLDRIIRALDLYEIYKWEKDEAGNPIWPHLLPISPNGRGDHYCLDLSTLTEDKSECKVVFWQHDYEFSDEYPPLVEADTFLEFLWNLLMEIKEDYNYDGSDKK
jgi:cell wall assembly regulator SMI1